VSGANNADTLIAAANLANTLFCMGKYEEALEMQQQVLQSRMRLFGAGDFTNETSDSQLYFISSITRARSCLHSSVHLPVVL
jgi:hypothetical protein